MGAKRELSLFDFSRTDKKFVLTEFPRVASPRQIPDAWKRMLAYITGSVNEDLLCRIEYLLEENCVLRNQIQKRILLTDHERHTLTQRATPTTV